MTTTEWAVFFDDHAPQYDGNIFTRNTVQEVDFLIEALQVSPGASILDIGCGTGRHAVELARHGYRVTGLDISAGMLAQARQRAAAAQVEVVWLQADATRFAPDRHYDAVICLCEGAFGLLGSRDNAIDQPLAILRNAAVAMKPQANCLFTVLNGFALIRKHTQADVEQQRFDPLSLTEISECRLPGNSGGVILRERGFVPTELRLLFGLAGLTVLGLWGEPLGTGDSEPSSWMRSKSWCWGRSRRPSHSHHQNSRLQQPPGPRPISHYLGHTQNADQINDQAVSAIELIMCGWMTSSNPRLQLAFVACAFGPPPQEIVLPVDMNKLTDEEPDRIAAGTTRRLTLNQVLHSKNSRIEKR